MRHAGTRRLAAALALLLALSLSACGSSGKLPGGERLIDAPEGLEFRPAA